MPNFMETKISKFFLASFVLLGTIIGAGFFSLPYLLTVVGGKIFFAQFFILFILVILVHLLFGEIATKTPDEKRLPGFVRIYLGKNTERFSFFVALLGILGGQLVYLILAGQFLKDIFSPKLELSEDLWAFFSFLLGFLLIYFDIRAVSRFELLGVFGFLIIFFFLFFKNFSQIHLQNFSFEGRLFSPFLPFGPILFSFWGLSLIPEIEEMLKERKQLLKSVIFFSFFVVALFYLLFIFFVTGICPKEQILPSALLSLKNFLKPLDFKLLLIVGFFTVFTSFVAFGLTLKKILWYDLNLPHRLSFVFASLLPFTLYLLGVKNFLKIISFLGSVGLGLEAILVLLIYKKIGTHRFLSFPLIAIFLLGIFFEFQNFLK